MWLPRRARLIPPLEMLKKMVGKINGAEKAKLLVSPSLFILS